ncbi:OTU-domain-containing protein [Guyanagaster necrorhizus]|uniref:Ubiquitin thioesterase OTU n=1 Tax=Guyanagaster necrorhizus TaxID=856835 RepID=A0A9P7VWL5_9AGAR|nr:OTU-domain-containing protein [Guyanagaster necrorhizus MCA 3950]KAG7447953.1 OTU-domain-containing protein [Guyanagaster necrorhizus MCA 3950]
MTPVRLRHPKGTSTISVPFDDESYTVQDLQQEIRKLTDILPSRQILKHGYPPQSLALIGELPISSLGLTRGDQLIVSEEPGHAPDPPRPSPSANLAFRPATSARIASIPAIPASSLAAANTSEHVPTEGGVLIHRVVPDDNSCLFSSVALIFEQDIAKAPQMRQIVAAGIRADGDTYNDAILGQPPADYISKILKPSTWGGAIELGILAAHYKTEICSIDVETGRVDHFPPGPHGSGMRCILIYSGIHYDAVTLAPMLEAPTEWHQTVFSVSSADDSDSILVAAKKLTDSLRAKKAFTNTSTFDLKCEQCGQGLKGEKGARAHAEETGHVRFGEY